MLEELGDLNERCLWCPKRQDLLSLDLLSRRIISLVRMIDARVNTLYEQHQEPTLLPLCQSIRRTGQLADIVGFRREPYASMSFCSRLSLVGSSSIYFSPSSRIIDEHQTVQISSGAVEGHVTYQVTISRVTDPLKIACQL